MEPERGKITAKALSDLSAVLKEKGIAFVTVSQMKEIVLAKEGLLQEMGKEQGR